jgi:hypothetical protein
MTWAEIKRKWRRYTGKESSACQEHIVEGILQMHVENVSVVRYLLAASQPGNGAVGVIANSSAEELSLGRVRPH